MIKYTFTPSQLLNSYNLKVMTKVASIFDELGEGDYYMCRSVILEDLGSWLVQSDWTDRSGYYMTIRLAPLDQHRPEVREMARAIIGRFIDIFVGRNANETKYENQQGLDKGEKVSVFVHTDTNSIGD